MAIMPPVSFFITECYLTPFGCYYLAFTVLFSSKILLLLKETQVHLMPYLCPNIKFNLSNRWWLMYPRNF